MVKRRNRHKPHRELDTLLIASVGLVIIESCISKVKRVVEVCFNEGFISIIMKPERKMFFLQRTLTKTYQEYKLYVVIGPLKISE